MSEDSSTLVARLQEAIVQPDLLAFFRILNALDPSFDTQSEASHNDETVLASFVQLTQWHSSHGDVLEALLARGFDPTYATSQYFNPSEELAGVPKELHELLSSAPTDFQPSERVRKWLDTPVDRLDEAFGVAPPAFSAPPTTVAATVAQQQRSESQSKLRAWFPQESETVETPSPSTAYEPFAAYARPYSDRTMSLAVDPHRGLTTAGTSGSDVDAAFAHPAADDASPSHCKPYGEYRGQLPPPGWNQECDRLRMRPIACAGLFVLGSCTRYGCKFDHGPLPWAFDHENVLPGSPRQPTPSPPSKKAEDKEYEPLLGSDPVPPFGWRDAFDRCDVVSRTKSPCAHFHLLNRCKKGQQCGFSHEPVPKDFHHVNLPPWASREGTEQERQKEIIKRRYRSSKVAEGERPFEAYTGKLPPPAWYAAWLKAGGTGPEPCAHFFIRERCNYKAGKEACPFSHDRLPRDFYHINLPPTAPRQGDGDEERGRSRSPVRRRRSSSSSSSSPEERSSERRRRSLSRDRGDNFRRDSSPYEGRQARRSHRSPSRSPSRDRAKGRSRSPRRSARRSEDDGRAGRRSRSPPNRAARPTDDADDIESTGVRRSDMLRLNGLEIFGPPEGGPAYAQSYKKEYCHGRTVGCRYGNSCRHAHTERELEYYVQEKWRQKAGDSARPLAKSTLAESLDELPRSPTQLEPDLSSLEGLGLSDQQKRVISSAIRDPTFVQALQISLTAKQTSIEQAQAALSDPTPAFPHDAAQEGRYRDYLRKCASQRGATEHLEPVVSKITSYNDNVVRWNEEVTRLGRSVPS